MGNVINFPGPQDRDWRVWEDTIRQSYRGSLFDDNVIEDCLPAIKEHWKKIHEAVSLQPTPVEIPGPLTEAQVAAIRQAGEGVASVVIEREAFI